MSKLTPIDRYHNLLDKSLTEVLKRENELIYILYELPKKFISSEILNGLNYKKINELSNEILTNMFFQDKKLYNHCILLERYILSNPYTVGHFYEKFPKILENIEKMKQYPNINKSELEAFYRPVQAD